MLRGLYTAASGMLLEKTRTDVIANNLANVNTTGFKRDSLLTEAFPQLLLHRLDDPVQQMPLVPWPPVDLRPPVGWVGVGAAVQGTATDFTQGQLVVTDNPLDVALVGRGFLVVEERGGLRYTRNGSLALDSEGYLVTSEGARVLGLNGPVAVSGSKIQITAEGEVLVDGAYVDTLQVVDFPEPAGLVKEGDSLYRATAAAGAPQPAEAEVRQGVLERSNVNSIQEMIDLIAATRAYEANQKMVLTQDQLLGKAVNEVGRVG
ncbi:MAG: flagellar basal-body rod protein FlgF [Bacillota bacterium]|nr:flagellar basal-body rod protein FlgF [Bacillota bacterium]